VIRKEMWGPGLYIKCEDQSRTGQRGLTKLVPLLFSCFLYSWWSLFSLDYLLFIFYSCFPPLMRGNLGSLWISIFPRGPPILYSLFPPLMRGNLGSLWIYIFPRGPPILYSWFIDRPS
jgi:hypothetical protein